MARRDKQFSLVDVARLVSGKSASDSAQDVRVVLEVHQELKDNILQFKFPGAGRYTTLPVVLRLRTRVAQRLSFLFRGGFPNGLYST